MTLDLRLAIRGDLRLYKEAQLKGLSGGSKAGAIRGEAVLKGRLRADVLSAGLGNRVANTWRGKVFPERGESLTPAAIVYSRAAHIKRAFEEGATIRSNSGFWLAIPSDNVPDSLIRGTRGRGRLTPGILEQRLGIKLRFVPVFREGAKGRFGLLVADKVRRRKGKRGGFAKASARALKKGEAESVVMFILVPQVTLRKRLHIADIERQMASEWPDIMQGALDAEAAAVNEQFGVTA